MTTPEATTAVATQSPLDDAAVAQAADTPSVLTKLLRAAAILASATALLTVAFWLAIALGNALLEEGSWWLAVTYLPLELVWLASLLPALPALAFKRWRAAAALGATLTLCGFTLLDFQINPGFAPDGEPTLRVLTLNAHQGSAGFQPVLDLIQDVDPDVFVIQEANTHRVPDKRLPGFLARALEDTYTCHHAVEFLLCSREPVLDWQAYPIADLEPDPRGVFAEITIEHRGRPLRILTTHLDTPFQPQHITPNDENLERLKQRAARRDAQLDAVLSHAEDTALPPALLLGDFNTPPRGYRHRRLTRLLQDAWAERGRGLGHTYVRGPLSTRIDYILAHPELTIHATTVRPESVSDHRALTADLAWR